MEIPIDNAPSWDLLWDTVVAQSKKIAALEAEVKKFTSTNNASPKLPNPPCMVCTNGDKYAGNHGNYCQWCGRQLRAIA